MRLCRKQKRIHTELIMIFEMEKLRKQNEELKRNCLKLMEDIINERNKNRIV